MRRPVEVQRRQERVEDVLGILAGGDLALERAQRGLELAAISVEQALDTRRKVREALMAVTGYEYRRAA